MRIVKEFADKLWTIIELSFGQFSRRDVVTDNYFDPHPLKDHARTERGSGTTSVDISLDSPLPKNFTTDFMLNTANRAALYKLLTDYFVEKSADALSSTFVITQGKNTVRGNMPLSTHLEADYRIVTHVLDAIKCGLWIYIINCSWKRH